MQTRAPRIPIVLSGAQSNPSGRHSRLQSAVDSMLETPRKKIVINRRVVPKITIRVDDLIRQTYNGLASGKLKRVTDSSLVLNNEALIEYIKAIYETYDIVDPLEKYNSNVISGSLIRNQQLESTQQRVNPVGQSNLHLGGLPTSRASAFQQTAQPLQTPTNNQHTNSIVHQLRSSTTGKLLGQRSSSKSKIDRLKESIKEGSNYQPIEVRTISLSASKRSSASIKKQIMFGSPSDRKDESTQLFGAASNLARLTNINLMQPSPSNYSHSRALSTSQYEQLMQSRRHPDSQAKNNQQSTGRGLRMIDQKEYPSVGQQQTLNEINPIFRYCFMCECSVLEANITIHERQCRNFMELYGLEWPEIVSLLDRKISAVRQTISNVLNSPENPDSKIELRIRDKVSKWMVHVKSFDQNGMELASESEQSYNQITQLYESDSFKLLELTYKLRWFLRMRQRIKQKFGI